MINFLCNLLIIINAEHSFSMFFQKNTSYITDNWSLTVYVKCIGCSALIFIIIYQVSKFIHSSILLVKRGSRESHEIQLLTA